MFVLNMVLWFAAVFFFIPFPSAKLQGNLYVRMIQFIASIVIIIMATSLFVIGILNQTMWWIYLIIGLVDVIWIVRRIIIYEFMIEDANVKFAAIIIESAKEFLSKPTQDDTNDNNNDDDNTEH